MYQINSDSEGDEGSDIVPEGDEGSESDDALGANIDGTAGVNDRLGSEHGKAAGMGQHAIDLASSSHQPPADAEQSMLCNQQASDVCAASCSQHSAMQPTLPYGAGRSSLPSQQTLLYPPAPGTQHSNAGHSQQAGMVDPDDTQPTAVLAASSPVHGSSIGSPVSPASGSAKKNRQADIRGFLSPRALRH